MRSIVPCECYIPASMEEAASALILRLHPFLSPSELYSLAGGHLLGPPSCVVMPICHAFFIIALY